MKHVRRSLFLVAATATTLVASAGAALGQQYPPTSGDPGGGSAGRGTGTAAGGSLASTGSDLTLLWVGLAVLMIGVVAFVATRRRASTRGALREALN